MSASMKAQQKEDVAREEDEQQQQQQAYDSEEDSDSGGEGGGGGKRRGKGEEGNLCTVCEAEGVVADFINKPCACCRYCKKCAMKMATGGKCPTCKQFFVSFAREDARQLPRPTK